VTSFLRASGSFAGASRTAFTFRSSRPAGTRPRPRREAVVHQRGAERGGAPRWRRCSGPEVILDATSKIQFLVLLLDAGADLGQAPGDVVGVEGVQVSSGGGRGASLLMATSEPVKSR